MTIRTKPLIEQHIHGCYGVDFNKASVNDVLDLTRHIKKEGIGGIFPTLVTDSVENTKRQTEVIKEAQKNQGDDCAKILGIHLEGIFINPKKKGIHNPEHFMEPTIENFKKIEDESIKIVTLAPELCKKNPPNEDLIQYLKSKGIKVQAGHCVGSDLSNCDGTTHTYNAMSGISHREGSTTLSALLDDDIYTEVIGDGVHVSDDALKLLLKTKPDDKVLLVSDSLPCTHSDLKELVFADEKVYFDGERATSAEGTLAGSTSLLPDIIKILASKNLFKPQYIENPYRYHNVELNGHIDWDDDWNILDVQG